MQTTSPKSLFQHRLAATLGELSERGIVTRKEVEITAGTSHETARRWFLGTGVPDGNELHLLIRDMEAHSADAILACLLSDSRYQFPGRVDASPDLNGDGRVDTRDGVDGSIEMTERIADALKKFRGADGARTYTQEQAAELQLVLGAVRSLECRLRKLVAAITITSRV